jgi:hypothetical protein
VAKMIYSKIQFNDYTSDTRNSNSNKELLIKQRIVSEVPHEERRVHDGCFRHFGYNCLN